MNETTKTTEYEMTDFGPMPVKETVTAAFKTYDQTLIHNFSIHQHDDSCVRAYSDKVGGCKSTGADVMLTFGSTVSPLDGNNKVIENYRPSHIDVFINREQAERLIHELQLAISK